MHCATLERFTLSKDIKEREWDKQKSYYFEWNTHDMDCAQHCIKLMKEFSYYAYIKHEPDDEDGSPHYHFLVHRNGSRSVRQICDFIDFPSLTSNFIRPVRHVVGYRRYLMHLDDPDKHQYSEDDVVTNDKDSLHSAVLGNNSPQTFRDIYSSFIKLRNGSLTVDEFISNNYVALQKLNFYQQLRVVDSLDKIVLERGVH